MCCQGFPFQTYSKEREKKNTRTSLLLITPGSELTAQDGVCSRTGREKGFCCEVFILCSNYPRESTASVCPPSPSLLMGKGRWHLRGGKSFRERTSVTSSAIQLTVVKLFAHLQSSRSEPQQPNQVLSSLATNTGGKGKEKYKNCNIHGRDKSPAPTFNTKQQPRSCSKS